MPALPKSATIYQTDGSMHADLDPALAATALMNLINAVTSLFTLLGSLIGEEYGQPADLIYQEICRTFLHDMQSERRTE